jgi:glycosyltransferase involved in cell wall biosynthesis
MKPGSKVTALVPAYQAAGFIQKTLDSLSAQTYDNFDVLISVDFCDDDTYEICRRHAMTDNRFKVIRITEKRLGYVGNCNFLMRQAQADYVMLAFHDDLLEPAFTSKLCAALDSHPEAVLAFSDVHYTPVEGPEEYWEYTVLDGVRDRVRRGRRIVYRLEKWWVPNRGMFRLDRSRRIGGIKHHGANEFSVDWPWLFHMSLLGEFVRVPEVLCHKYRKPGSLSRAWDFSPRQYYEATASCMRELWNSELTTEEKTVLTADIMKLLGYSKSTMQQSEESQQQG